MSAFSLSGALKQWQFGRAFLAQWLKSIMLQVRWTYKSGAIHFKNVLARSPVVQGLWQVSIWASKEHSSFRWAEWKAERPSWLISKSKDGASGMFCNGSFLLSVERYCPTVVVGRSGQHSDPGPFHDALGHGNGTCIRQAHCSENGQRTYRSLFCHWYSIATGHYLQPARPGIVIPNLPLITILLSSTDKENIVTILARMVAFGCSSGHYIKYYSMDRILDRRLETHAG